MADNAGKLTGLLVNGWCAAFPTLDFDAERPIDRQTVRPALLNPLFAGPTSLPGIGDKLGKLVEKHFDLRPKGIIHALNLLRPIYFKTAAYGHFGRDEPEFTWEATDKVPALKADAGIK